MPTAAQRQAIPKLLSGENVFLVSQTGRGKTLAYLIPLVEKLVKSDEQNLFPQPNRPRGLIVVPSRELASQVTSVIRTMFGRSVTVLGLGNSTCMKEKRILTDIGVDIVVGTASRIASLISHHRLSLKQCQMVVVDEADTLNEPEAAEQVKELILKKINPLLCQVAIVGATRTAGCNEFLKSLSLVVPAVVTADAHMTVPHVRQQFVSVGRRKRTSVLAEIVSEIHSPESKIMVFVNSVRTCNFLSRFIRESPDAFPISISVSSLHGSLPPKIRKKNFKNFSSANLLVCTDLASRGLDIPVDHVVMYDFPNTLAEYLHRAGRTARAGRQGSVTALITKKNLGIASQVKEAARAGVPITWRKQQEKKERKLLNKRPTRTSTYSRRIKKFHKIKN